PGLYRQELLFSSSATRIRPPRFVQIIMSANLPRRAVWFLPEQSIGYEEAIAREQFADGFCQRQQSWMRQALRMFSIILQRPKTHDPCMRTAIDGALIRNHQQLLTRLQRINARKPAFRFVRLKCDEDKRHKCPLFH